MRLVEVPKEWSSSLRIVADVTSGDIAHYLTDGERHDLARLKVEGRRLERAASRIAGKVLAGDVFHVADPSEIEFTKNQDRPLALFRGTPAPFSVSFTHSHGIGAAASAETSVGVDIERFREIRAGMTRFFLTPDELMAANELEIPHPLLHFWSAKEAAFKVSEQFHTLLRIPLEVVDTSTSGLTFVVRDLSWVIETRVIENGFVAALARRDPARQGP